MRTVNVIAHLDPSETYNLTSPEGELTLSIRLDDQSPHLSSNVWEVLTRHGITPRGPAIDLLRLALTVYTADQIISRDVEGYQGWSRHIRLHMPVQDVTLWQGTRERLETTLSFLSGDKWELVFRQAIPASAIANILTFAPPITKVCLLSGGLDSLIGALDLLDRGDTVAFVSHHKAGSEHRAQEEIFNELVAQYGTIRCIRLDFYVQPNQGNQQAKKEGTSRARSFLFLSLGLVVANFHSNGTQLIVPENGLISLNIPLTEARLGSHSTRTTHPYFLTELGEILQRLGISVPVVNPYQFKTKGEMMQECTNQAILTTLQTSSLSCSHAENSRLVGQRPGIHCGYCVPCIIRQSAEFSHGGVRTTYVIDIHTHPPSFRTDSGRDLRAFRMALERLADLSRAYVALEVLRSGPLPINSQVDLDKYVGVYQRGMNEVRNFLA
jgi:7-cyano-7-deazaguanine synthase in queuosine biosynthesis